MPSPEVALESTVIAHGLPYPRNVATALELESIIRDEGALPRTLGIVGGRMIAGLSEAQIEHLGKSDSVHKVSLRNLPIVIAKNLDGATTVASTLWMARKASIAVFSTGGIGGVHRGRFGPGTTGFDISADLEELARNPVTVVCGGAKAILDVPATLEYLETKGVTVIGYRTDEFPAFYSRESGLGVDVRCDNVEEIAEIILMRRKIGLVGGVLVAVPCPHEFSIPRQAIDPHIQQALEESERRELRSAEVTPFLLKYVAEASGGRGLEANLAVLRNNARVAAKLALALQGPRNLIA